MNTRLLIVPLLAVAIAPACANKKFVTQQVGEVNQKVDSLSGSLEQTQARTTKNEERIGQVDQKADAAGKSAAEARSVAENATTAASTANAEAKTAATRVAAVEAAAKRLVFEVTLSEDQGNFQTGKAELPDQAKSNIDELVNKIKSDPKGAFFEIEGHTDNVGATEINDRLGLDRAETVKRYLYEAHRIPLHKISVISYGEEKPVSPNNTRDGRAQNRRVVIRVLS